MFRTFPSNGQTDGRIRKNAAIFNTRWKCRHLFFGDYRHLAHKSCILSSRDGRSERTRRGRKGGGCQTWSRRCIFVEAAAARGKEREGAFLPPLPFTFQHSYFLHSLVPYYFVYHVSHTNSHIYVTRSLPPPLLVEEEGEGRGEGGRRPLLPNEFSSPLPPLQFKLCRPGRPTFTWCQPSPGPGTVPSPSLYPKINCNLTLSM